jgi:hypothetical protein
MGMPSGPNNRGVARDVISLLQLMPQAYMPTQCNIQQRSLHIRGPCRFQHGLFEYESSQRHPMTWRWVGSSASRILDAEFSKQLGDLHCRRRRLRHPSERGEITCLIPHALPPRRSVGKKSSISFHRYTLYGVCWAVWAVEVIFNEMARFFLPGQR